jgi:hypothetical protein
MRREFKIANRTRANPQWATHSVAARRSRGPSRRGSVWSQPRKRTEFKSHIWPTYPKMAARRGSGGFGNVEDMHR